MTRAPVRLVERQVRRTDFCTLQWRRGPCSDGLGRRSQAASVQLAFVDEASLVIKRFDPPFLFQSGANDLSSVSKGTKIREFFLEFDSRKIQHIAGDVLACSAAQAFKKLTL